MWRRGIGKAPDQIGDLLRIGGRFACAARITHNRLESGEVRGIGGVRDLRQPFVPDRRPKGARLHQRDPDAERRQFMAQAFAEAFNGKLGGGIRRVARKPDSAA